MARQRERKIKLQEKKKGREGTEKEKEIGPVGLEREAELFIRHLRNHQVAEKGSTA